MTTTRSLLTILLLLPAVPAPARQYVEANLITVFTSLPPAGWSAVDSLRVYRGQDLYRLLDSSAGLFLEYGFTWAGARRFMSGHDTVDVDVMEMRDTLAAYGIFSLLAADSGAPALSGQEGVHGGGFLLFRKARFIVSVTAADTAHQDSVEAFARAVDERIPAGGERPDLVDALLRPNFRNLGIVVLRGPLSFEKAAGLGAGDLFHVRDGVAGRYHECRTFILRYSGSSERDTAAERAVEVLTRERGYRELMEKDTDVLLGNPKSGYLHIARTGRYLLLTQGPSREEVLRTAFMLGKVDVRNR